jgi:hypothetical protein
LPVQEDVVTRAFFKDSICCVLGDGANTLFWTDPWLQGHSLEDWAPDLTAVVLQRWRSHRSAIAALDGQRWLQDIRSPLTVPVLAQYILIMPMLDAVVLTLGSQDRVIWQWTASGEYSERYAYWAMFLGQCFILGAKELWKVKASRKCLFMVWLALQDRWWTAARRSRHGL